MIQDKPTSNKNTKRICRLLLYLCVAAAILFVTANLVTGAENETAHYLLTVCAMTPGGAGCFIPLALLALFVIVMLGIIGMRDFIVRTRRRNRMTDEDEDTIDLDEGPLRRNKRKLDKFSRPVTAFVTIGSILSTYWVSVGAALFTWAFIMFWVVAIYLVGVAGILLYAAAIAIRDKTKSR